MICHSLEVSESVQLCVKTDIGHSRPTLLLTHGHRSKIVHSMKVSLLIAFRVIELSLFDFDNIGTFSCHLVQLGEKFVTQIGLLFVESLDS